MQCLEVHIYNSTKNNAMIFDRLLNLIAPYSCLVCENEGNLLCDTCAMEEFSPLPDRCYRCFKQTPDSQVCKSCKYRTNLKYVWVASEYNALTKQLVHKLKFEHSPAAADIIAAILDRLLPYFGPDTLITHVPTSPVRVRHRGFDHAKLIAKALAERRKLPYASVLARSGNTRQVGAKRDQRVQQLKGEFRVVEPRIVQNTHVVLIDDVTTTGATLEEAGRTIHLAGAKSVNAAAFAQKLLK